jgi:hypothetical protein
MIPADDLTAYLMHQPASVRAAYCMAWRSDKALWLSAWQPGQRTQVRLAMKAVCR